MASIGRLRSHVNFLDKATELWYKGAISPGLVDRWRRTPPSHADSSSVISKSEWMKMREQSNRHALLEQGYVWVAEPNQQEARLKVFVGFDPQHYDVWKEYEKARKQNYALATPHGYFWSLPPKSYSAALTFLAKFGPLRWRFARVDQTSGTWVDFREFWAAHLRFKLVTQLWLTLESRERLCAAFSEMASHLDFINSAFSFPIGSVPELRSSLRYDEDLDTPDRTSDYAFGYQNEWVSANQAPELVDVSTSEWLRTASFDDLVSTAVKLVRAEIHCHLRGLAFWVNAVPGRTRPKYEIAIDSEGTLWEVFWQMFVADTQTVGWRICPNHSRLFYPPRVDRFFCTTEEQAHFSASRWWAEHKEEQLRKRKQANRQRRRRGSS